jgi:uncharacterized protein
MNIDDKFDRLKESLKKMDRVIIALSGGVDSTFLLKAASESGLRDILAVTGISESLPVEELAFTERITSSLDVKHRRIITDELKNEKYADNPPDRCYYCKKELFSKIKNIAAREKYPFILDGSNTDDSLDRRPGKRAAIEEGVLSPLDNAGLTKDEIRKLSRSLGLPTWDKPATPCLSSRFPYGETITSKALENVHKAESYIKQFGIKELRVRHHGDVARIEIHPREFSLLLDEGTRQNIVEQLKTIGYQYVTLDLKGFRSGSANEVLPDDRFKDSAD